MIKARKFWRNLTRVHKWMGAALGIQLVLWCASGFFMSYFDLENVRGAHVAEKTTWSVPEENYVPIELAMTLYPGYPETDLYGARLKSVAGQPVYELTGAGGNVFVNARTGTIFNAVKAETIRIAADRYYKGTGSITLMTKLDKAPIEYRGSLPVWQVTYNDRSKTRLYLTPDTAELKSVRTRLWRVYDFMWMLHIMDYEGRDNINSWWLKLVSFCALLFALSGMGLVAHRTILRPRPRAKV